ncbi:MAG TPA: hypothetical protein VEY12_03940 [Thermoplasmata archaeon]|nr:hypothetical protein [Thermoplasmata archaeon]
MAGIAVGLALVGVYASTAFLIITALGVTLTSAVAGYSVAGVLAILILLPVYPHVRNLAAWHPLDYSVPIQVLEATLGMFHQELKLLGEGHEMRERTNARRGTITAALRLAHPRLPESEARR